MKINGESIVNQERNHKIYHHKPNRTYKKEWKGMGDWLGTGNIATKT